MMPSNQSAPERILIVNPFGIGDVLFTTPLVKAVRHAFPESQLDYLCNRRTEAILRKNPHLSELFVYEKDEVIELDPNAKVKICHRRVRKGKITWKTRTVKQKFVEKHIGHGDILGKCKK